MELINAFSFELPTRIVYGPDILERMPSILGEFRIKYPAVITDKGVRAAGVVDRVAAVFQKAGFAFEIFDGIEANPKDFNVDHVAAGLREHGCDGIVAVGGGSPIDGAKAVAVVATHGGSVRDYAGPGKITRPVLPIIAIPTTAGTGSEVTFGAVITDTRRAFKFTVKGPQLAPRVALLDPSLTLSMPASLTAATGMDALTHAVEAYTVKGANPLSDAMALEAIALISQHLKTAVSLGSDLQARAGMILGSLLAGIAFSHSDVGAVHCIAEALGGMYDLPHGVCNAVVLPAVMGYNRDWCPERYARIGQAMGISITDPKQGALDTVAVVRQMARDVGLPAFADFKVNPADFSEIAAKSAENGSNSSNPRPMTAEDYTVLLQRLQENS